MRLHLLRISLALSFLIILSGSFAAQKKTDTTDAVSSQARAVTTLEAGLAALGGIDAIREAKDIQVTVKGYSWARNQSVRVNPPYDKMTRDENLYIDVANRRYIVETRDPLPGGFVFGGKQVINGTQGFFVDPRNKTIAPLNLANFNSIGLTRRVPHLFLMAAYETAPATLRWVGQENYKGQAQNVISFASANGVLWTLYFDNKTNLLTKYDQLVSDNLSGNVVQETIFPAYQTVGKLKVPTGRITTRAGETIEDVNYSDVKFNNNLTETAFAKPDGLTELPLPTPPPARETKLADGVYLFESGSNSLVVEFKDYVIVVEPYAGGRGPKPTINKVREMFPAKPIKYVVVTHHHDDHSGGLRSYVAQGITVVTTPTNKQYFEKMAAGDFTINRDDQTKNKKPVLFEFLENKKKTFTDGTQTLEIIDIGPSPHAEEMLIAYLPKARIVFQGDLVNLPASGQYAITTVNDSTIQFFEAIKKLNLDIDRITAVHGPTTTVADLQKAIEQRSATP